MGTYYAGPARLDNIHQDARVIDMSNELPLKAPRITPILFLSQRPNVEYGRQETGAKSVTFNFREVFNVEFKWMEDALRDFQSLINFAAGYSSSDTVLTVDDADIFQVGDLVLAVSGGEIMRVDASDTTNNLITVTRSWGTTAAGSIADNAVLVVIGNVNAENARSRSTSDRNPVTKTNYIQTARNPFDGSDKSVQTELYGIKDLRMYKRNKIFTEHLFNIEASLIAGEPNSGTEYGGSAMELSTGGFLYFMTENTRAVGGPLTKADFESWLANAFQYGSDEKYLFCGSKVSTAISKFAGDMSSAPVSTVQVQNLAKEFGIKIRTYMSDNGIVHIIRHGWLDQYDTYKGYGLLIDPKHVRMARLRKGDWMKLYTDIQESDRAGWKDEYRSDFGLEFKLPSYHGLITGVTG